MKSYKRPFFLFNAHLETIYPALFRSVAIPQPKSVRITTPDDDFLDYDWYHKEGNSKVVIISHGLEGNSKRAYVRGMARAFIQRDFDVVAWNYRGCSDEMNSQLRFYHSGATDDLSTLVDYISELEYTSIYLIGFSLGGNLTLKYLGEQGSSLNTKIQKTVAFSVPLNLHTSCLEISKPSNSVYTFRFLRSLKKKIMIKAKQRNDLPVENLHRIKNLIDFDDAYTAPLHGFSSAIDYYTKCSSINFIDRIDIPTLIINAKNDPFLSPECYPKSDNKNLALWFPEKGGHVGFTNFHRNGLYWSEDQALKFILSNNV
ncbi:MAG: alpha/beta fold hydrolase [Flammeovirgaceae bacterium]|nr:alpha/beta fold hydrolase [Flammeovirgaceae bacterium]